MKPIKAEKEKRMYSCRYCGNNFITYIGRAEAYSVFGKPAKHGSCSDQVRCPKCKNFMANEEYIQKW
jgi:hypothetical protein